MFENVYESSEFLLYKKNFDSFKMTELDKLKIDLKNKLNRDETKYNFFAKYLTLGIERDTCFLLIKTGKVILDFEVRKIIKNKNIDTFISSIEERIKLVSDLDANEIDIEIGVFNNKKNKNIIKKMKQEFCNLNKLLNPVSDNYTFEKLNSMFFSKVFYLFIGVSFVVNLILVNELSNRGILIDFISIETVALIINIFEKDYLLILSILGAGSYLYVIGISFITAIILNITLSFNCEDYKKGLLNTFKYLVNISFLIFIIGLLIQWKDFDINIKENLFTKMIHKYISETRTPTYRKVYIKKIKKNEIEYIEQEVLITKMIYKYLSETRNPTYRKVYNKDFKGNESEYLEQEILIMGESNGTISYLNKDDIKNILNKTNHRICEKKSEKDKHFYLPTLLKLLSLNGEKFKDKEDREDYGDMFIIANNRYRMVNKKNIIFDREIHSLSSVICSNK